jgi:hypothetical protein
MGAGRPKGSKSGSTEAVLAKKIAVKLLKEKAPEPDPEGREQTVMEHFWRQVLKDGGGGIKAKDTQLRGFLHLMAYGFGRPAETPEDKGGQKKNGRVLVLPDKDDMNTWMKKHSQDKVEEKDGKPN